MKRLLSALSLAALALGVQAEGEITLKGKGVAQRAPEWISVELVIQSECFKTPRQAQDENDQKVVAIQQFLTKLQSGTEHDKVATQGGATRPFSREIRDRGPQGETLVECKGTFQKTTRITFTSGDIANFSSTFLKLQEEVLNSYNSLGEAESPRSYATISQPSAGVCEKTSKAMKLEALALAQDDARSQFEVVARQCNIEGPVTITHRSPSNSHDSYDSGESYYAKSESFGMGREAVSLDFGPISESRTLPVTFRYPSPSFTVCAEHK